MLSTDGDASLIYKKQKNACNSASKNAAREECPYSQEHKILQTGNSATMAFSKAKESKVNSKTTN